MNCRKPAWEGGWQAGTQCTPYTLPPPHPHPMTPWFIWFGFWLNFPDSQLLFFYFFPRSILSGTGIFPWKLACLVKPQLSMTFSKKILALIFWSLSCWLISSCEWTHPANWPDHWVTLGTCQNYRFLGSNPSLIESEILGKGRLSRWGSWGSERLNYRPKSIHVRAEPGIDPRFVQSHFLDFIIRHWRGCGAMLASAPPPVFNHSLLIPFPGVKHFLSLFRWESRVTNSKAHNRPEGTRQD